MQKYVALRTLATIERAVALLVALFGIAGLIPTFTQARNPILPDIGIAWAVASLITSLLIWSYTDLLYVFMDIERNTRGTWSMLSTHQGAVASGSPALLEEKKGLTTLGLS